MRVNLAKRETGIFSLNWIRVGVTILIIILIVGLGLNYYILDIGKDSLNNEINSLNQQLRVLTPKKEEYLNLKTQVSQLEREFERVEGKYIWAYISQETGFVIPQNVELKSFSVSGQRLSISGNAENTELLINYIDNMNESPFFGNVTLQSYINQDSISFDIASEITKEREGE